MVLNASRLPLWHHDAILEQLQRELEVWIVGSLIYENTEPLAIVRIAGSIDAASLPIVGARIQISVRARDAVGFFDDSGFLVVLPNCKSVVSVAARLRSVIARMELPGVTTTSGVACAQAGDWLVDFVQRAENDLRARQKAS